MLEYFIKKKKEKNIKALSSDKELKNRVGLFEKTGRQYSYNCGFGLEDQ